MTYIQAGALGAFTVSTVPKAKGGAITLGYQGIQNKRNRLVGAPWSYL